MRAGLRVSVLILRAGKRGFELTTSSQSTQPSESATSFSSPSVCSASSSTVRLRTKVRALEIRASLSSTTEYPRPRLLLFATLPPCLLRPWREAFGEMGEGSMIPPLRESPWRGWRTAADIL